MGDYDMRAGRRQNAGSADPAADGSDGLLRGLAGLLLAGAITMSAKTRRKAAQVRGAVSWRDEGVPTIIALRGGGLLLWGLLTGHLFAPRRMRWASLPLPRWLRWAGAGAAALMFAALRAVLRNLGDNITPTVATTANHRLVTSGPYRWVRHPLYSAGTGFFLSIGCMLGSWVIAAASGAALLLLRMRLPNEEAHLITAFGDEYRDYQRTTGAFLPRLSQLRALAAGSRDERRGGQAD